MKNFESKISRSRADKEKLKNLIMQRKKEIERIEMELGTVKATILRMDCT